MCRLEVAWGRELEDYSFPGGHPFSRERTSLFADTKKLNISTMKSPNGDGTKTWDKWEMRIHRRLIDLDADDRTMRQLMRLRVPEDVFIEVNLSTK